VHGPIIFHARCGLFIMYMGCRTITINTKIGNSNNSNHSNDSENSNNGDNEYELDYD
jgi:hypothetical protein